MALALVAVPQSRRVGIVAVLVDQQLRNAPDVHLLRHGVALFPLNRCFAFEPIARSLAIPLLRWPRWNEDTMGTITVFHDPDRLRPRRQGGHRREVVELSRVEVRSLVERIEVALSRPLAPWWEHWLHLPRQRRRP